MVRLEFGMAPLGSLVIKRVLNYYKKLANTPNDQYIAQCFSEQQEMHYTNTFAKGRDMLSFIFQIIPEDEFFSTIFEDSPTLCKQKSENIAQNYVAEKFDKDIEKLQQSESHWGYSLCVDGNSYSESNVLKTNISWMYKKLIVQCRIGNSQLALSKTLREKMDVTQDCTFCNFGINSMNHFFIECSSLNQLRNLYLTNIGIHDITDV